MDVMLMMIGTTVLGLIGYAIMSTAVRMPGQNLNQKFVSLGNLKGKTLDQIVAVAGKPTAVSSLANGNILYQWQATGYHIAILFDSNNICIGITSEISS